MIAVRHPNVVQHSAAPQFIDAVIILLGMRHLHKLKSVRLMLQMNAVHTIHTPRSGNTGGFQNRGAVLLAAFNNVPIDGGIGNAGHFQIAIDEPDAKIVRKIFEMRADGKSLGTISDWLYESRISSPTGKECWSRETISKLLKNEKYTGDVMLQKTFVKDLFSGKQIKNDGELERYLIQEHHPAIVNRELFDRANKSFINFRKTSH